MTMPEERLFTTISVRTRTRDALKRLGRKGETYDEIIHRLIHDAARGAWDEERG